MKASIVIFLLSFLFNELYSQQNELISDSLITGKQYKIVLDNRWETEGVLMNILDESLLIETGGKYITIRKTRIKSMKMISSNEVEIQSKEQKKIYNIYLNDSSIIKSVKLEYIKSDTLFAFNSKEKYNIPINKINKIVIPNKSKFSTPEIAYGISLGAILGGLLGGVIGYAVAPKDSFIDTKGIGAGVGALTGIIAGGIIGAIITVNINTDDEYDFTSMDKETKEKEIKSIMSGLK